MRLIISVFLISMGIGFYMLADLYPEAAWIQSAPVQLVYPVVVVLVGLGLIFSSKWLLKRDPDLLSWGILGVAGCLMVGPLLAAKEKQGEVERIAQEAADEERKSFLAERRRQQQMQKAIEEDRRERMKDDRFAQYERSVSKEVLDSLRELDKDMKKAVDERSEEYTQALNANPTKGPNTWIRSRSLEELEVQVRAYTRLYEETRAFAQFIENFEATYTASINALELKPPADRIAVAELERILQMWERTNTYTLRQLDVGMLSEALKALNVLKNNWGSWEYNPRKDELSFANREQELTFHQAVSRMQDILKEYKDIQ